MPSLVVDNAPTESVPVLAPPSREPSRPAPFGCFGGADPVRAIRGHMRWHLYVERFWKNTERTSGCWLWMGKRDKAGYGYVRPNYKLTGAHRFSWELTHGPIPSGLFVCHRCDNPPCVNPEHLFTGTARDNTSDAIRKGRLAKPKITGSPTAQRLWQIRNVANGLCRQCPSARINAQFCQKHRDAKNLARRVGAQR